MRGPDATSGNGESRGRIDDLIDALDLDDVMRVAVRIQEWDHDEEERVAAIVRAWAPGRAVYHLLLHVRLIPIALRHGAVIRALDQRDDAFLALGGVVAVQELGDVGAPQWSEFRDRLVALLDDTPDLLASRVSTTFALRGGPDDVALLAPYVRHANETVRENTLVFLFRAAEPSLVRGLVGRLLEDGLALATDAAALRHWLRNGGDPPERYRGARFSYLPNYPTD